MGKKQNPRVAEALQATLLSEIESKDDIPAAEVAARSGGDAFERSANR